MMLNRSKHPFILSLKEGDNLFQCLLQYADFTQLNTATLNGVGALSDVTLSYYQRETKQHTQRLFKGTYEIASLTGNLTLSERGRFIHLHAAIGDDQFDLFGGHLINAYASASTEITVTPLAYPIIRKKHPELNIQIICPFQAI